MANFDLTQTEHKNVNIKQISGSLNRAIYDLLNNSREKIVVDTRRQVEPLSRL
jgi:hypothetical protein